MKTTRVLLILALAVISGLAAGYAALRYLSDRPMPVVVSSARGETVPVVLAARDLPLGSVLEDADLRVVDWPAGVVPAGFAGSKEELVGRSLVAEVQTNEAILATKLAELGLRGIIPLIPPGMRALSIRVDQVVGVAGFVTPQTRVDVILIMTPVGGSDPVSKVILQNVQALAAGAEIQETEDGRPVTVPVVTVLVTPAEAEKLALASHEGEIRLALRNTLDMESVETGGERASRLFAGTESSLARPTVRTGSTAPTARESIIEIYRGGVRTLVSY
jgi:pilus assembly protein CpaB